MCCMNSSGIKLRLSHAQWSLKPQDLAMAFKLVCLQGRRLPYAAMAHAMHMSPFEAHACIARLNGARLLVDINEVPTLVLAAFRPLVLTGAAYFFPAVRGEIRATGGVRLPVPSAPSPFASARANEQDCSRR